MLYLKGIKKKTFLISHPVSFIIFFNGQNICTKHKEVGEK